MGVCTLCGKAAGFFRSEHSECRKTETKRFLVEEENRVRLQREQRMLIEKLSADVTSTIKQGGDLVALEARLVAPVADGLLDFAVRQKVLVSGWQAAVDQMLEDGVLSEAEDQSLVAAMERFSLKPADLDSNSALSRAAKATVLRRVMEGGPLPATEVPAGFPVNLQRGEVVVWIFHGVDYLEDRVRRQFVGGSQGVSLRVMKGVYYRVGAFKGESVLSTQRHHVDTGMLVVTNANLYFHSASKSTRIPYRKIVSFEPFKDAIGLMRDAQTAKPQIFVTMDGWFTYNLVTNLARG